MTKETITWRSPTIAPPPVDDLVLVCFQDGKHAEVYLGYQDENDVWRDPAGVAYDRVLAWAPMPRGVPA